MGKTADEYIGYKLYVKEPVNVFTTVDNTGNGVNQIRNFERQGTYLGRIYSYVIRNGQIWWMLDDNPTNYKYIFVKHAEGKFDVKPPDNNGGGNHYPVTTKTWQQATLEIALKYAPYGVLALGAFYLTKAALIAFITKPAKKEIKLLK